MGASSEVSAESKRVLEPNFLDSVQVGSVVMRWSKDGQRRWIGGARGGAGGTLTGMRGAVYSCVFLASSASAKSISFGLRCVV